jgi:hypothetical protein
MALVAEVGYYSHRSAHPLSPMVLLTLLDLRIEGVRASFSISCGLAKLAGLSLEDPVLFPDPPLDFEVLAREFVESEKRLEKLLADARASGLPVYPPFEEEDE